MKILHLYTALNGGGVERFLLNYYMFLDRSKVKFDVIVPGQTVGILEKQFSDMGSKIYHVKQIHEDFYGHISEVYDIVKSGQYDAVHCHGYKSVDGLILAWLCKIKVRIIHSHMAYEEEGIWGKIKRKGVIALCKLFATKRYACGIDAGIWMFGKRDYERNKFKVIHNAIDLEKYKFDIDKRFKTREHMQLQDKYVIGNVARLTYQKNHEFLIKVFNQVQKQDETAVLLLVGSGELEDMLKKQCQYLGIADKVIFLGTRDDVPELLNAMDIFVLPSFFEGLPVSLVEVQASGLRGIIADSVTQEVNVSGYLQFISLNEAPEVWAKLILDHRGACDREMTKMQGGKYDIRVQAKGLQEEYLKMMNG